MSDQPDGAVPPQPVPSHRRTPVRLTDLPGYRRWRLRWQLAVGVMVVAGVMAVSHILEHLARIHILPGVVQDLVLGYPTAAALFVGGLFLIPRR